MNRANWQANLRKGRPAVQQCLISNSWSAAHCLSAHVECSGAMSQYGGLVMHAADREDLQHTTRVYPPWGKHLLCECHVGYCEGAVLPAV